MSKHDISRRDFLKGTAAAGLGLAASTTLGSIALAAPTYKPGTYTATAYGNLSYVTVKCTFSETALTAVDIASENETPILFSQVKDQLIPAIIEHQAGGLDAITGATNSSRAVKEAIADCVAQAGGDRQAWLAKTVTVQAGADETYTADIAVIGCGAAGFMASITAGQKGLKVITLEKAGSVAGVNGIKVSGPFGVASSVLKAKEGGTTLNVEEVFQHVMNYTHWTPNPALIHRCLDESKNAVEQLVKIGYKMQEANFRFETPFKGAKGGFHLILNALDDRVKIWEKALSDAGVNVIYNTTATGLIMDGDKVKGVTARKADGTRITINAKAVIIASGGYLGNRDLQAKFLKTSKLNAAAGGNSLCTGDGIMMAADAGAVMTKTFGYCPCEYGGTNTKASRPAKQDKYDQNYAFKFGLYGNLLVDAEGKRFINEMETRDIVSAAILRGPGKIAYLVFDQSVRDSLKAIEGYAKQGLLTEGETLRDLATKLQMPADTLEATIAEYNGFVHNKKDAEFSRNPASMERALSTAPFYAIEIEPAVHHTMGGLKINTRAEVQNTSGASIPALFAAGEVTGGIHGGNRLGGNAIVEIFVSGDRKSVV